MRTFVIIMRQVAFPYSGICGILVFRLNLYAGFTSEESSSPDFNRLFTLYSNRNDPGFDRYAGIVKTFRPIFEE